VEQVAVERVDLGPQHGERAGRGGGVGHGAGAAGGRQGRDAVGR
jgi:hypothetical protein